jgi:cyclopropane fatty-acyl-phospholipid synthase-like methyltransferase
MTKSATTVTLCDTTDIEIIDQEIFPGESIQAIHISDFTFQISDFRFQISDFASPIQKTYQHTLHFYALTLINHKKFPGCNPCTL